MAAYVKHLLKEGVQRQQNYFILFFYHCPKKDADKKYHIHRDAVESVFASGRTLLREDLSTRYVWYPHADMTFWDVFLLLLQKC